MSPMRHKLSGYSCQDKVRDIEQCVGVFFFHTQALKGSLAFWELTSILTCLKFDFLFQLAFN